MLLKGCFLKDKLFNKVLASVQCMSNLASLIEVICAAHHFHGQAVTRLVAPSRKK